MKLSIIESEYQKTLFLGGLKSLKMNYRSQFYVVKVVISKRNITILLNSLNYMQRIHQFWMNFILFAPFKSQVFSHNSVQLFQIVGIFLQFDSVQIFQIVGIFLQFSSIHNFKL